MTTPDSSGFSVLRNLMSSPNVRLALAIVLALSSLTFLAVTLNAAKAPLTSAATTPPLKAKLLRRKDKLKDKLDAAELADLKRQTGQDQKEERELEDTTPKHVPIKVQIKKEKEQAFKDLKNEHWIRDLEIEVRNTGTKPIYFLHLQLNLDIVGPDGKGVVFVLLYGRSALVDVTAAIKPEDVPIRPGETHTFTIAERFVRGYEGIVRNFNVRQPKKVSVIFQQITFGDGTGLWNASGDPLPHPKRTASAGQCNKKGGVPTAKANWPLIALNVSRKSRWSDKMPAFLPAIFLNKHANPITIDTAPEPDTCCPSSSCTWAKSSLTRCYCSSRDNTDDDIPDVDFLGCGEPGGACSSIVYRVQWCDYPNVDGTTFQVSCSVAQVFSCFDYAPTPPPPPSPRPPSPTPTPTPCVPGVCEYLDYATQVDYCVYGSSGCPAGSVNYGRCCFVQQTPTATPTPTAQISGGGGGGSNEGEPHGGTFCTEYWWVWFYYNPDSGHWEPTGEEEYAGCW